MSKHWIAPAVLFLAGCYFLNRAAYFAWRTATPLTDNGLRAAQCHYEIWLGALLLSLIIFTAVGIRMFVRRKSRL
jgi:hypothetical protein